PAEADDISLAIRHRTEVARDEAQEAIRKIDAGVYGACELCAAPISFDRLEAMPTTRHCRACAT
ncbi:MAG: TraR/DksA C4-type zinc finger protein, partial [Acidimicrobiia bacterium]|nr:TraR/DksA C4-type zinc finger protein [Acidimicrobiia bacterium]